MRNTPVEMIGRTFGRWLVLARGPFTKNGRLWRCRCSCGVERGVLGHNLRRGDSRSCGCRIRAITSVRRKGQPAHNSKGGAFGAQSVVLARYRCQARARGVPFGLTREEAVALFAAECFYCGIQPAQKQQGCLEGIKAGRTEHFIYNGIDRVDSSRGYVHGNVVSCCGVCNRAKRELTVEQFLAWAQRLNQHQRANIRLVS